MPQYRVVVGKNLFQGVGLEVVPRHKVEVLAEREPTQTIAFHYPIKFRILLLQPHDTGACEDNFQPRVVVVALAQLLAPVRLLEDLVNLECPASMAVEFASKVADSASLEVEVVHVDVKALAVASVEMLLCVLKEERSLANASGPLDANEPVVPVNLIHKGATNRSIGVFH